MSKQNSRSNSPQNNAESKAPGNVSSFDESSVIQADQNEQPVVNRSPEEIKALEAETHEAKKAAIIANRPKNDDLAEMGVKMSQELSYTYAEYVLPREDCFINTSFQGLTVNGRIPSGNQDIQVFAKNTILSTGELLCVKYSVNDIKRLQYYCLRECFIENGDPNKSYLDRLRDFPKYSSDFQSELRSVKAMADSPGQKLIFPLRVVCDIDIRETLFYSEEAAIVLVPTNAGFINGVINLVYGNCSAYMKKIYIACKLIRQGKEPVRRMLDMIKDDETEGRSDFDFYVISEGGNNNDASMKIKSSIQGLNTTEIAKEMSDRNKQSRKI